MGRGSGYSKQRTVHQRAQRLKARGSWSFAACLKGMPRYEPLPRRLKPQVSQAGYAALKCCSAQRRCSTQKHKPYLGG